MRLFAFSLSVAASALCVRAQTTPFSAAQEAASSPAALDALPRVGAPAALLSGVVRGPFDVEGPTGDNRCLGVEHAFGYVWITGAGHTTTGPNRRIHQYDLSGAYLQSFPQVTNSAVWGGRDLSADEANLRLFAGAENGELSEYAFDPQSGPHGALTHVALHSFPLTSTIRALARDPGTGHFFTADFGGALYELALPGVVVASYANPGVAAYGAGFDWMSGAVWWWSQTPDPNNALNLCRALEWSTQTHALTGRAFQGLQVTAGAQQLAGGCDVYVDPANYGALSLVTVHQTNPDSVVAYDLRPAVAPPNVYCTSKTSSLGCVPSITTSAPASAPIAGAGDYDVIVTNVNSFKQGLIFYSRSGPHAAPFQGGFLCVQPPTWRTGMQNSGGVGTDTCTGVFALTVNENSGPALDFDGYEWAWFQAWFRDPQSPATTGLSNALALQFDVDTTGATPFGWTLADGAEFDLIVASDVARNARITNDGPSSLTVERYDANGVVIETTTLASGQTQDVGAGQGESLKALDGAGAGGASGSCSSDTSSAADWSVWGGGTGYVYVVRNSAVAANYRIHNDGPSQIRVRTHKADGTTVDTYVDAGATKDVGVGVGDDLEVGDNDGASNGGATGTYEKLP